MQSKNIQNFTKLYFAAEARAFNGHRNPNQLTFLLEDKIQLVKKLKSLITVGEVDRVHNIASILATMEDSEAFGKERKRRVETHRGRLKYWLGEYESGNLKIENATAVKKTVKPTVINEDVAKFKRNLIDSAKSICHSAMKNNLSEDEIHIIFNSGLITAKEERKVQETKGVLQAFLRQNGITKDVAMQILEGV